MLFRSHAPVESKKTEKIAEKVSAPMITPANPISHYNPNVQPIASATWRKRAHVEGQVSSIKSAASGNAPRVDVEIWDATGGITLQFLGRRSIAGLKVGSKISAEGMVGEEEGSLTILNPSYEIVL